MLSCAELRAPRHAIVCLEPKVVSPVNLIVCVRVCVWRRLVVIFELFQYFSRCLIVCFSFLNQRCFHISPNSCLQHGVLALNLLIHWGPSAFPSSDEVGTFQPNCSAVQNLDSSFIAWTSKSCCGCSQAQNCLVRHFGPPSLGPQSLAVAAAILKIS